MLGKQSPWLWSMNYKWISKQISHPPSRHDTREIGNLLPSCLRKILNIWAADRCEGVIPSVGRFRWKLHISEFLWRFSTIFPWKPWKVLMLMRFRIRGCTIDNHLQSLTVTQWDQVITPLFCGNRIVSLYLCVCLLSIDSQVLSYFWSWWYTTIDDIVWRDLLADMTRPISRIVTSCCPTWLT